MTVLKVFNRFPSHVVAFVTQRPYDFRLPDHPPYVSKDQRDYLSVKSPVVGIDKIVNIRQVHGNCVLVAKQDHSFDKEPIIEADGIVTRDDNLALVVRTADCLPIFIYDNRRDALGLVHAGWKGSQKKIVLQALQEMQTNWQSRVEDLTIAFGPAIGVCCYEVGGEFQSLFPQDIVSREDRWFLNLPSVNKNQLIHNGVPAENIYDCGICTCCHQEYFSYRREGLSTGRNLSLIMKRAS